MIRAALILALSVTAASAQTIPPPPAGYKIGQLHWGADGLASGSAVFAAPPSECRKAIRGVVLHDGQWVKAGAWAKCR